MVILVALVLGFAPGLLWLAFFLKEDVHPEPKKMIAKAFLIGGLSAFVALIIEYFAKDFLGGYSINIPGIISDNLSVFIGFAIIEEVVKFYFIWQVIHKSPYFDEPIDAMIYMVTGALGFATAENLFLVISGSQTDVFLTIALRFVGATLLHALSSAIMGYLWAWGIKHRTKEISIVWGLILASLWHAVFNVLVFKFNNLLVYPTVFLAALGFFVLYDFEKLRKEEMVEENRSSARP